MASARKSSTPATDRDRLVDALVQTSFATMTVLTRVAAENELSLTQLRVLAILRDRRLRMSDLAEYLGLDRSTMTGLVDRGVKRGLLFREASDVDRRTVEVGLTPAGQDLARSGGNQVAELLMPLSDRLNDEDRRRVSSLLERMLAAPSLRP